MQETIFVSLARRNEAAVRPVLDQLTQSGLNLWVYYRDIKAGRNWRTSARTALVQADRYMIFLSPESVESVNVRAEALLARCYRKPTIPVMLSDCDEMLRGYEETRWLEDLCIIRASDSLVADIQRAAVQTFEPYPLNTDRIFITYAPSDADYALRLAADLRELGGQVWIDAWKWVGGVHRFESRTQGLMNADYLVCCLSMEAIADAQVRRDLLVAFSRDLPIVPVIAESAASLPVRTLSQAVMADESTKDLLDINWIRQSGDREHILQQLREAFDLFAPREKRKQGIFISYRRADSVDASGRLYDRLVARFGAKTVFKDVMNIPPGVKFADHIAQTIADCAIVLVLIGDQWLTIGDAEGRRRLDNPDDLVRIEIEQALQNEDVLVIPVCLGGASMPKADRLPVSITDLTRRNAIEIRHDPDFHSDVDRLIAFMEASRP